MVGADPKIRALEKRFKSATPTLVLNKKGMFDYDERPEKQCVNHFENVSFTTKDMLTRNLIAHFGSEENIGFYPESVLYDDLSDRGNVETKYYKSLLASLTRLLLHQHHQETVLGNIDWIKGALLLLVLVLPILTTSLALQPHKTDKETASVIKFIAEQHANFDVVDKKTAWLVCETFHRDLRDEVARLPPIQKEWFLL